MYMTDIYDTNQHSVFLLNYHLIMCTKYRRKVINDPICKDLEDMFIRIGKNYNITLEKYNHDEDHVHILFRAEPKSELSKFINAYKSASSRIIKKEYPGIKDKLYKGAFWSQSFFLLSTGGITKDIVKEYIQSQGE